MSNFLESLLEDDDESRVIYVHEDITEEFVSSVIQKIDRINKKDDETESKLISMYGIKNVPRQPITVDIMSRGGQVDAGFALIASIEQSKTPVNTRINGYAYSFALTLFLSGEERSVSRHAKVMYHQLSYEVQGTLQDVDESVVYSKDVQKSILDYFSERASVPKDILRKSKKCKKDIYFTPSECLKYGIATKIL